MDAHPDAADRSGTGDRPLHLVFSPCPNDTFVFWAWVHGRLAGAPPVTVAYHDVDEANAMAAAGVPDLVKVSYGALPWLLDGYDLLPCGGAVGRGCGPLLLAADAHRPAADLASFTVAVPGERTTAYLLLRLWAAQAVPGGLGRIEVMPFEKIMPAVRDGRVDAGLVIHEARFTYPAYGLASLVDLGAWWEADTGLPIPLGAIMARRRLPVADLAATVRASVAAAWAQPSATGAYVAEHAQEMDPRVAGEHIALYVNGFTADLGEQGYAAVEALLGRAADAGLVPRLPRALRG